MKKNCFSPAISLDTDSLIPLREQIAEAFRKSIGRFRPEGGTRVISENRLAEELAIHRKTVHQAYVMLLEEKFFVPSPTRGVLISSEAQALCRKPFPSIALVMPYTMTEQLTHFNRFGFEIFAGIVDRAAELGAAVNILALPSDESCDEELDLWLENSVMRNIGIIDMGPRPGESPRAMKKLLASPLPHVLLSSESDFPCISTVRPDYEGVYDKVIRRLAELGHRHMVCITENSSSDPLFRDSAYLRTLIAAQTAEKYGLTVSGTFSAPEAPGGFAETATDILKLSPRPTAAVCRNDAEAADLIAALKAQHCPIPEAFSVIGFDRCGPGIAGCSYSRKELGHTAVEMICDMDKNWKPGEFKECVVPAFFYEDSSLGPAPALDQL